MRCDAYYLVRDRFIRGDALSDLAYAARHWKLIEEAGRGTDTGAATEDRGSSDQGRKGGSQRIQERDFQLAQQSTPSGQEAGQVVPCAGLFGAPTTRDFTDACKRRRDANCWYG